MELKVSQPFIISQIWSELLLFLDLPGLLFHKKKTIFFTEV
ncbi:hypothetical protein BCE_5499 [Bacillus cereus ATCC 10987]|uniref:Uncharacterized protein n=1 Tax=Bacillus cereus (strain ATCC 10987 / NRS 248) TaxID=222523 RepID=Q72X79_BACC1|nr:hypothetical protein BCE_5499 [Bacillus cereus ATCC 10987]